MQTIVAQQADAVEIIKNKLGERDAPTVFIVSGLVIDLATFTIKVKPSMYDLDFPETTMQLRLTSVGRNNGRILANASEHTMLSRTGKSVYIAAHVDVRAGTTDDDSSNRAAVGFVDKHSSHVKLMSCKELLKIHVGLAIMCSYHTNPITLYYSTVVGKNRGLWSAYLYAKTVHNKSNLHYVRFTLSNVISDAEKAGMQRSGGKKKAPRVMAVSTETTGVRA